MMEINTMSNRLHCYKTNCRHKRKELDIVVCSRNFMPTALQFSFLIRFSSLKANTVRIKN